MRSAVAQLTAYKQGDFFSEDFVGRNSWNGHERNLLFANMGDGTFSDVARPLQCDELEESRGVAIADLDRDGKLDIVMNNNAAPPTIYLNRIASSGSFVRFGLRGDPSLAGGHASSPDALGARVELLADDGGEKRTLVRQVEAGSGFAAQSESTLHFGLGETASIDEVKIRWPSGREQVIRDTDGLINREWILEESAETWAQPRASSDGLAAAAQLGEPSPPDRKQ